MNSPAQICCACREWFRDGFNLPTKDAPVFALRAQLARWLRPDVFAGGHVPAEARWHARSDDVRLLAVLVVCAQYHGSWHDAFPVSAASWSEDVLIIARRGRDAVRGVRSHAGRPSRRRLRALQREGQQRGVLSRSCVRSSLEQRCFCSS